jgi:hypothetical protein
MGVAQTVAAVKLTWKLSLLLAYTLGETRYAHEIVAAPASLENKLEREFDDQ